MPRIVGRLDPRIRVVSAGDIACGGYAGTLDTISASFIKTWEGTATYGGTYRITFTLTNGGGADVAHARIYRNGSAVGTDRTTTSSAAFSEDITGWVSGDLIQIYQYNNPGGGGNLSDVTLLKIKTASEGISIPGSSAASVTI